MDQQWFEMEDIRHRKYNKSVWLPLRALQKEGIGRDGYLGFQEEFFGCACLAIPIEQKELIGKIDLHSINYSSHGYFDDQKKI